MGIDFLLYLCAAATVWVTLRCWQKLVRQAAVPPKTLAGAWITSGIFSLGRQGDLASPMPAKFGMQASNSFTYNFFSLIDHTRHPVAPARISQHCADIFRVTWRPTHLSSDTDRP